MDKNLNKCFNMYFKECHFESIKSIGSIKNGNILFDNCIKIYIFFYIFYNSKTFKIEIIIIKIKKKN